MNLSFAHAADPSAVLSYMPDMNAWERGSHTVHVVAQYSRQCTVGFARQIAGIVRRLSSETPEIVPMMLEACASGDGAGTTFLRACLQEASGNSNAAAACFLQLRTSDSELSAYALICAARNFIKACEWNSAADALRRVGRMRPSQDLLTEADSPLRTLRQRGQIVSARQVRLALVGTSTFDFWVPALNVMAFGAGIDLEIFSGRINQYRQELLDPASRLAVFQPDVIFIAIDPGALGIPEESPDPARRVIEIADEIESLWTGCQEHTHAAVVQHNFEIPVSSAYGALTQLLPSGRGRVLRALNEELLTRAAKHSGVTVLDVDQTAAVFGKAGWADPVGWYSMRQYPSLGAIPHLAARQIAYLRALLGLSCKCIVTDLDGTLWGGVIAEDGIGGIHVGASWSGEPYRDLQSYLKAMRDRGILLAVCSKNNESDAQLPFREHPDMVLRLDHFSAFEANWNSKSSNIRKIASELNIGLDAVAFLDDSPLERSLVAAELPEVTVIELRDPEQYVRALDSAFACEALTLTQEDRMRIVSYAARPALTATAIATNPDDVIRSLQVTVALTPLTRVDVQRAAQLLNKTNQFNVSGRRHSEVHVGALLARNELYTQCARVRDRFNDYGLTGVLFAQPDGDALCIESWVLSCRVLGRRVEDAMFHALVRHARLAGYKRLKCEYHRTERNSNLPEMFERLGFCGSDAAAGTVVWTRDVRPADDLSAVLILDDTTGLSVTADVPAFR